MDIDLVYLWVDGNDPAWQAKKAAFQQQATGVNPQAVNACRFVENDELKYSLRSAEKFAPWIRRIYIVTDNQTPSWLDTTNPRIRIVDHREILPPDALPVFNSNAIELRLAHIPNLAEHFLVANDDTLFGLPVEPSFFFDDGGRPIVRLKPQSIRRHLSQIYCLTIYRMQELICARFGKRYTLAPHHNIDAYLKSAYRECMEEFADLAERTVRNRFRTENDLQRVVVAYFMLAKADARLSRTGRYNRAVGWIGRLRCWLTGHYLTDSRCIPLTTRELAKVFAKYNPALFAVNDSQEATDDDRRRMKQYLETKFPEKSAFEK